MAGEERSKVIKVTLMQGLVIGSFVVALALVAPLIILFAAMLVLPMLGSWWALRLTTFLFGRASAVIVTLIILGAVSYCGLSLAWDCSRPDICEGGSGALEYLGMAIAAVVCIGVVVMAVRTIPN